jgi:hypothetical protein
MLRIFCRAGAHHNEQRHSFKELHSSVEVNNASLRFVICEAHRGAVFRLDFFKEKRCLCYGGTRRWKFYFYWNIAAAGRQGALGTHFHWKWAMKVRYYKATYSNTYSCLYTIAGNMDHAGF